VPVAATPSTTVLVRDGGHVLSAPGQPPPLGLPASTTVGLAVATAAAVSRTPTAHPAHERAPRSPAHAPSGGSGGGHGPGVPSGPADPSFAFATATGSGGGVTFALWCAILVGLVAWAAEQRRRHRFPLALVEPAAFVSPQQRPG
jgi:hypothetical protein